MQKIILFLFFTLLLNADNSYYDRGKLVYLNEVKTPQESRAVSRNILREFETKSGKKVGVKGEILLKCKSSVDCPKLLASYESLEIKKLTDKLYLLRLKNPDNVFKVSRELYESGEVEFAHPNLTKQVHKR